MILFDFHSQYEMYKEYYVYFTKEKLSLEEKKKLAHENTAMFHVSSMDSDSFSQ